MARSIQKKFIWVLMSLSILAAAPAFAEDQNSYVGVLGGSAFPSGSTDFNFGVDAGYKLSPMFDAGAFVNYFSQSITSAGTSFSTGNVFWGAEGNYLFPPDIIPGMLHLGAKVGFYSFSSSSTLVSGGTNFMLGPDVGYDYIIAPSVSIGAEFNLLFVTGTSNSGNTTVPQLLAAVKYWF